MRPLKTASIIALTVIVMLVTLRLIGYRLDKYAEGAVSMRPTLSPGNVCLSSMNSAQQHRKLIGAWSCSCVALTTAVL
jgi:hypothetical protein